MDRRSVLTGMAALPLVACQRPEAESEPVKEVVEWFLPETQTLDLSDLEATVGGRLGFGLITPDYRLLSWRSDERFVYCSTFKSFLAAATFERIQNGQEQLDREIPVTTADMTHHAPVTEPAVGGTLSVEALMKGTVELSDNPAANLLLRELGGLARMQEFYRSLGDAVTRVDRWEPEMNRLDGDKDTTSPRAAATNLFALLVNRDDGSRPAGPLDDASRTKLLGWMFDTPTGPGRIKAGLPAGWTTAHKTGTGGYGPTNDIGVIYAPDGTALPVAVYYHADRSSSDADRDAVIAEAVRRALRAIA
ncbi:MAG: class A beta-lactamase [Brevundimonas sp.]|uniref:class A beta-lactamase n=1 Tax=Brevundimonas sp. TaxID=1871086 RepID=UPI002735B993|nr:class A beta-lactamase [Brevundimonas sp.]MDP3377425.1 class A beta-lactamase [Brevundimonas sp.]